MLLLLLYSPLPVDANVGQQQTERMEVQSQEGNLLTNPGFEDGFYYWNGISELHLAEGWVPWWIENPEHTPTYFRPEYKQARAVEFPQRVRSGNSAQQWFKLHSSFYAGIYQQVSGVVPGQPYRFSLFAQIWSSIEDNPSDVSTAPANPHLQIGIDPTGNIDPFSVDIIWSHEASMDQVVDDWSQLVVEASARESTVTVFVRTRPDFANKHNNIFLDDASLESVLPPESTATATASEAAPVESSTDTPLELPEVIITASPTVTVQAATLQPVDTATEVDTPPTTEEVVATEEPPVQPTVQPPTNTPETAEEPAAPLPSPLPTDMLAPEEAEAVVTDEPLPSTEVIVVTAPVLATTTTLAQEPAPTSTAEATAVAAAGASPTVSAATGAPAGEAQDEPGAANLICATPFLGIALLVPVLIILRPRGWHS